MGVLHMPLSRFAFGFGSLVFVASTQAGVVRPDVESLEVLPGTSFGLVWLLDGRGGSEGGVSPS